METTKSLVLTAENLELKIGKKSLGQLTTNALDIKAFVEQILPNYDVANYNENNIESAKKDKALLNASAKALNDERIKIEKEWMIPFDEFKTIVNDTCKLIKSATDKIDGVVKESEAKEKATKRGQIVDYFDGLNFTLVPLEKFFDEKWLNKTSKLKDVQLEIKSKCAKISDDIITIEAIGTDIDLLKALYLDTLNLNNTIQYANTLKANRETAQKEAETRKEVPSPVKEVPAEENPFAPASTEPITESTTNTEAKTELLVRTMKVTGTYDQLVALGNFMNDNGISFEKLENE
ncbi:DUF1351 domain-containing protein [Flavobacterium sp.]|uniref:DUF1351 domain-containing protein n=1 Tax=Flavobacterium sp. TaxID=239 RepID=UPI00262D888D|nr:DUF1351 domain-containing protein [Flavobacterium sp.]